jgi:type IV secretory pathway TrbF-like protein
MAGKTLTFRNKENHTPSKTEEHAINQMAKQQYQEKWAGLVKEKNAWKMIASLTSGALMLAIIGMYMIASQSRIVPFVVKVDQLGAPLATQRADSPAPPNEGMFKQHLASWIENTRSVYTDAAAEKKAMKLSFGSTKESSPAQQALLTYMEAHNPYHIAEEKAVSVNVQSVQPISDKTWRVEWLEKTTTRSGSPISEENMQATIEVSVQPPSDEATIITNPLGIYVERFNWSNRI